MIFVLVVDNFGVKYTGKHNIDHLINKLHALYTITVDQTWSLYCGLNLAWDYARDHVNKSMPNYIKQALHKFKHLLASKPEDAPHKWNQPVYGVKQQLANAEDNIPVLPPSDITHIQTVVGTLIYYAIDVDNTMLVTLGDMASFQTKGIQKLLTPSPKSSTMPPPIRMSLCGFGAAA